MTLPEAGDVYLARDLFVCLCHERLEFVVIDRNCQTDLGRLEILNGALHALHSHEIDFAPGHFREPECADSGEQTCSQPRQYYGSFPNEA